MKKIIVGFLALIIILFAGCSPVSYTTEKQIMSGIITQTYKYNTMTYNRLYTIIIRVEAADGHIENFTFQQVGNPPFEWNVKEGQVIVLEKTVIYQNGSIYQVWYDWTN